MHDHSVTTAMGFIDKLFDFDEGAACKLIIKAAEKQRSMNELLEEAGDDFLGSQ